MSIRLILCIFSGADCELSSVHTALVLAKEHGARVRFLHLSPDPSAYVGLYGEGMIVSGDIVAAIERENLERLGQAKTLIAAAAIQQGVPLDAGEFPIHHACATFHHVVGMQDRAIAREGRLSDLIVVGKNNNAMHDAVTPALFSTGRPVLVVPAGKEEPWQDKTVAIAWDGGLQAARALYSALPLISKAEMVYVLTAQEHGKALDLEAESGVMAYLHMHGMKAQAIVVAAGQRSLPESLLIRAKDMKVNVLVMGAYGHSMLREMILGGVTEYMLVKADIPLLLSH